MVDQMSSGSLCQYVVVDGEVKAIKHMNPCPEYREGVFTDVRTLRVIPDPTK